MNAAVLNDNPTRYRIARWLRAILEEQTAGRLRPDKLLLRHVNLNERQVDIASFVLGQAANDNGLEIGDLAMRIEETAHGDAEGLGGLQLYVIVALCQDRPVSRLPVRIAGGGDLAVSGVDEPMESEPATQRGMFAQGMRHLEAMTRLHAEALGQLVTTQQRTIARLAATNEVGEERRLKAVEVAESMISERQERVLKAQESASRQEGFGQILEAVLAIPPQIRDYLTGDGEKRARALLELHGKLVTSFRKDPRRFERMLAVLSPEEQEALLTILDQVPPEPEPRAATANGAPEAGVAGAAGDGGGPPGGRGRNGKGGAS